MTEGKSVVGGEAPSSAPYGVRTVRVILQKVVPKIEQAG